MTTFYDSGGDANNVTLTEPQPAFVALAPEQTPEAARTGWPIHGLVDLPARHIDPVFVPPTRTWRTWASGFGAAEDILGSGTIGSHKFRSQLEFGRHFDGMFGSVTPFVVLEIAELRSNGFGERSVTGPGLFRLNVSGQSTADAPGFVRLRFQNVIPRRHELRADGASRLCARVCAHLSQIGKLVDLPNSTFLVDGARPARDAAGVKAGGELKIGPNSMIFAKFDGESSGVHQLSAGNGGVRWTCLPSLL